LPHDPKLGETVRVVVTFTDNAGAPLEATGVTVSAKRPDGTTVVGTVASGSSAGLFNATFAGDMAGSWLVKAQCTGPVTVKDEKTFTVSKLRFDIP
jgi:uncharacterized protein YfaS (alpha-2-macroglobulin family)